MKILTTLVLAIVAQTSFGQISNELEHYLEEKIRDVQVREYVTEHALAFKAAKDAGQTYIPEGKTPASFMASLGYQSGARGINHDFAVTGGAEPFIAMNPLNPDHLAVTYMSRADLDYPIFVTLDGGVTWTQSSFSPIAQLDVYSPGTFILGGGDPILAFDNYGTLHLTYIYAHGSGFPVLGGMYYVNSSDGGFNFTVPSGGDHVIYEGDVFAGDLLDRQWMACDNTGGSEEGALYMSAVYFGGGFGTAGQLVLKKSLSDTGFTSNVIAVPFVGAETTQFGNVKVDDAGTVHVACMRFDGTSGAGAVLYTNSTDGAATFSSALTIANATTGLPNNAATHIVHSRDNAATSLAVDGDNVYISWSDFTGGVLRGFFSYSSDNGATFSTPSEFGEVLFGPGFFHVMPHVAADNGRVAINWYKVDTTTMITDYMMAESDNAGVSFNSYAVVSSSSTDFLNEDVNDFYGDYNASEKSNCRTYSVFSDGRGGTPVVYFVNEDGCQLGVKEVSAINGNLTLGDLYPNPANDEFTISIAFKGVEGATIELVDLKGAVLLVRKLNLSPIAQELSIDLSEIAAGTYHVRIQTENEFAVRTLIKK